MEPSKKSDRSKKVQDNIENIKIDPIGALAGGIAHDFNNLLMTIMMNTEFAFKKLKPDDPLGKSLDLSYKAAIRARDLADQLLTFSRNTDETAHPLSLFPLINESLRILKPMLPANIKIRQSLKSKSGMALSNPAQIQQILIDLCINASEKIKKHGGILFVSLTEETFEPEKCPPPQALTPGRSYLRLFVSSSDHNTTPGPSSGAGKPLTQEEMAGADLSAVLGIIKDIRGTILSEKLSAQHAAFDVFIPMIGAAVTPEIKPDIKPKKMAGRILAVDDEEILIQSLQRSLGYHGYTVEGRTSGTEALDLFKQEQAHFDLVITDQAMPKMTGIDLAKKILSIDPDIPVILCTGLDDAVTKKQAETIGIKKFLTKPVDTSKLSKVISDILENRKK